jgi:polysaccharide biosynthesis/export protein
MYRKLERHWFVLFWILLATVKLSAQTADTIDHHEIDLSAKSTVPSYVIQANDLLEIHVWKDPELTRKVIVRPDGRISFPLVQDLPAAGLTPVKLKEDVERELKKYIEIPNVTVIVEAIQSYRVYVTGKVNKPGAIMSEKPLSVLQALSLAGGLLELANPAEIVVIRSTAGDNLLFRFNYQDVLKGKNFNQNMLLKAGDVVVVP